MSSQPKDRRVTEPNDVPLIWRSPHIITVSGTITKGQLDQLRQTWSREMTFKFHRGDYLSDLVTGFCGVVTSRCDSLTGCNQYYLGEKVTLERAAEQPPG